MPAFDVVFFDVDGTLLDARTDIALAMNHALNRLGFKSLSEERIISYVGTGVQYLVTESLGVGNEGLVEAATKMFGDYYLEHSADHARLYPHVSQTLERFRGKEKYILTNRYSAFADAALTRLGIRKYFKDIIGGDDEACLKPSPCVLEGFFKRTGTPADRCLVIGDMAVDVMAGKNSGMKTCWVTYGLGKRDEVEPLKPDYILEISPYAKTCERRIGKGRITVS